MNTTKNNLSMDEVELDYAAMLRTADVAFSNAREAISRHLNKLQEYPLSGCFYIDAQELERQARALTIVAETLYTLRNGLTRPVATIVNKPEIKMEG